MGALASPHKMAIQEHFLLAFGVDSFFFRRASADAAANVLEHLSSLEIISVNTSISLTTSEVFRPDILYFNQKTRTMVVFEVKRATHTERQTVTELAGYEQERLNAERDSVDWKRALARVKRPRHGEESAFGQEKAQGDTQVRRRAARRYRLGRIARPRPATIQARPLCTRPCHST